MLVSMMSASAFFNYIFAGYTAAKSDFIGEPGFAPLNTAPLAFSR